MALTPGDLICSQCSTPVRAEPTIAPAPLKSPDAAALEAPPEVEPVEDDRPRCLEHPDFPQVGTCARCGNFICIRCAPDAATSRSPLCRACVARDRAAQEGPRGLGGWLILLAIQVVLSEFLLLALGTLTFLYAKTGATLLCFGLVGLGVLALVLFFMKKKAAPFFLVAYFAAFAILALASLVDGSSADISGFIEPGIWCLYLITSRRVRNTFVR